MSTVIFDTQQSFEGSGSYYAQGITTTLFPGTLSMRDPFTAYCRGPDIIQDEIYTPASGNFSYVWRAQFTASGGEFGVPGVEIQRQNVAGTGWEPSSSFFVDFSEVQAFPYDSSRDIRSLDFCITEHGIIFAVFEIADLIDPTRSVVYLATNAHASYTGRNANSTPQLISSPITNVQEIFRQTAIDNANYDYIDTVFTFYSGTPPQSFGLIRVDYGTNPVIVYDKEIA